MAGTPLIETPLGNGTTDVPNAPAQSEEQINEATATAAGYPIQHDYSGLKPVGAVTPLQQEDLSNHKPVGPVTPLPKDSTQPDLASLKPVGEVTPLAQEDVMAQRKAQAEKPLQDPAHGSDAWYDKVTSSVANAIPSTNWRIGKGPYSVPLDPLTLANKIGVAPFNQLLAWGKQVGHAAGETQGAGISSLLHPQDFVDAFKKGGDVRATLIAQAHKNNPGLMGTTEGYNELVTQLVADPRNWPLMGEHMAKMVIGKLLTAGFTGTLTKGAYDGLKDLHDNWSKYNTEERHEKATEAGGTLLMAAISSAWERA